MNPIELLQNLRFFIHNKRNSETVAYLSKTIDIQIVSVVKEGKRMMILNRKRAEFLKELENRYEDIELDFHEVKFEGKMNFLCRLDTGEYAMVEIKVIKEDHRDRRALAYVAAFCGNQLGKDIKKVLS